MWNSGEDHRFSPVFHSGRLIYRTTSCLCHRMLVQLHVPLCGDGGAPTYIKSSFVPSCWMCTNRICRSDIDDNGGACRCVQRQSTTSIIGRFENVVAILPRFSPRQIQARQEMVMHGTSFAKLFDSRYLSSALVKSIECTCDQLVGDPWG